MGFVLVGIFKFNFRVSQPSGGGRLALSPSPDLFFGAGKLLFSFCEGEGDSTRESARGQFSIFGATEEKEVCGILVRMGVEKNLNERGWGAWSKRFWERAREREIFSTSGEPVVHRACTGNAEIAQ
jgi:hypothetical protein